MAVNGAGKREHQDEPKRGLDPMNGVLSMGPRIPVAVTIALAISLHAGVAAGATAATLFAEIFAWNRDMRASVSAQLDSLYEVDMVKQQEDKEPPPPPPPDEPPPPVVKEVKEVPKDEAPPKPAEAAAVLTADTPKDAPPDMVDFTTGQAAQFAGGQTSTVGDPNSGPVRNLAAANTGTPGGQGTAPAPPGPATKVDRSRAASLAGSGSWSDCPFPSEADAEQIDDAFVGIAVNLRPDGTPEAVSVYQDPGHGFAREARKCAMRKRYNGALDVDGKPVAATAKFRVHFQR